MLGEEDEAEDLSENYVMRIARWMVDATDQYDGDRFFTKVDDPVAYRYPPFHTDRFTPLVAFLHRCCFFTQVGGKSRATPMLVVLICIELSDVIFAVDSIPAVVGITQVTVEQL